MAIDAKKRPLCAAMAEKLKTSATQAAYRKRKWLSEPSNGWIKNVLGLRQFCMRGLAKVLVEWKLVCAALNLRRMAKMMAAHSKKRENFVEFRCEAKPFDSRASD